MTTLSYLVSQFLLLVQFLILQFSIIGQFSVSSTYMLIYVTTRLNPTLWIAWGFDSDSPLIFVPLSGLAFLALEQYGCLKLDLTKILEVWFNIDIYR